MIHGRNLERMSGSVGAVANQAFGNDPVRRCTREAARRKGIRWVAVLPGPLPAWLSRRLAHFPIAHLD